MPVLILLLAYSTTSSAQDRIELEKQRKKKLEEIAFTQKLLDETDAEQRENVGYLVMLKRQIANRQYLINGLDGELKLLSGDIDDTRDLISALESDVKALKKEYADMLYLAYRNNSTQHYLAFIFASQSINDAWKRLRLIKYYTDFRKNQVYLIQATQESMLSKMSFLKKQIDEKEGILNKMEAEKRKLLADKGVKNRLLSELKKKESDYRKKLKEDKKRAKELDEAIEEIIRAETLKARREESPADDELTELFASNQRRFKWPSNGVVASSFGRQAHPTIPNVYVNNNGIDIVTQKDESAACIFDGKVIHVVFIPGANNAVIVKHGEYYTVYKNLIDVEVSPGDRVLEGQPLGKVFHDPQTGTSKLHFEVRKQTEKLNPVLWLEGK